jgi:MAF protein
MNHSDTNYNLILASTSQSRRVLLERLGLTFKTVAPMIDETPRLNELPENLVVRLAEAKARAGATHHPTSLIIASDQVAYIDGQILGKPHTRDRAIAQLELVSGRKLSFYNGLCLLNASTGNIELACITYQVHFRSLTRLAIEGYVDREPAFDSAGSFKSEGLGIALFQRLEGDDPTALIGLPLIQLISMLERAGISPLTT